jgi:MYXO-CTERM domain-containing protein
MAEAQGGVLGFLDGLVNTAANTAVQVANIKANLKGPSTSDKTPVNGTSSLQSARSGIPTLWIVGGLGVLVLGAFLLLRRR